MLANERGRRANLARFGYGAAVSPETTSPLDEEWDILKADFLTPYRSVVPDLKELPPETCRLAQAYILARRELDSLMDACDIAHRVIRDAGPHVDLVEHYAEARDCYEDAVEAFGELGMQIENSLPRS